MKSYSQPEGEEVSDAQDRQEGMFELPPLKRGEKRVEEGWGLGGDEKARKSFLLY